VATPDLNFQIENAEPVRFSSSPQINFKLRVSTPSTNVIHSVLLKCQVDLDVSRRRYTPDEQQGLTDLFGEPARWGETLRRMLWTNTSVIVPSFTGAVVIDLPVPCTFDFNVAATKYFSGINEGEVPISFYFNGTVFYAGEQEALRVSPISWEKEAFYRMPIGIWRDMMDAHYPETAWLCLRRDAFSRLNGYKTQYGLTTFEEAVTHLVESAEATR
jgi:hypothetical protein